MTYKDLLEDRNDLVEKYNQIKILENSVDEDPFELKEYDTICPLLEYKVDILL